MNKDNIINRDIVEKNRFIKDYYLDLTNRYMKTNSIISKNKKFIEFFDGTKLYNNSISFDPIVSPKGMSKLIFKDGTEIEGEFSYPFFFERGIIRFTSGWIIFIKGNLGMLAEIPEDFLIEFSIDSNYNYESFNLCENYFSKELERYTTHIYREIQLHWDLPKDKRKLYNLPHGSKEFKRETEEATYFGEMHTENSSSDKMVPFGKGICNFKDGSSYQGSFLRGKYDGAGILKFPDWYYHGEFRNGNMHGLGITHTHDKNSDSLIGYHFNGNFIAGIIFKRNKAYEYFYNGLYGGGLNAHGIEISSIKNLSLEL